MSVSRRRSIGCALAKVSGCLNAGDLGVSEGSLKMGLSVSSMNQRFQAAYCCSHIKLAMAHKNLIFMRQFFAQLLGKVNRAMLPACAADADGYIAAVFLADAR